MKLRDISKYQGEIDFDKLHIDGLIIRAGYRGYSNGVTVMDQQLQRNIKEAKKHRIPFGLYFYSQAIDEKERQQEARILVTEANKHDEVLFLALDMELTGSGVGRADQLSKEQRQNIANTFADWVNNNGYTAVIYSNEAYFKENLDYHSDKYINWVANWSRKPKITHEIWQFTNKGNLPGIKGDVDLNYTDWTIEDMIGIDLTLKSFKKVKDKLEEISDLITEIEERMR